MYLKDLVPSLQDFKTYSVMLVLTATGLSCISFYCTLAFLLLKVSSNFCHKVFISFCIFLFNTWHCIAIIMQCID